jgi:hypothetical protein
MQNSTTNKNSKYLIILILIGIVLVLFFGFRMTKSFLQIRLTGLKPNTQDAELIKGWMTIPYIAKMYGVPPEVIYQQLNINEEENDKRSLAEINQKLFSGQQGYVIAQVKEIINQFRQNLQTEIPNP